MYTESFQFCISLFSKFMDTQLHSEQLLAAKKRFATIFEDNLLIQKMLIYFINNRIQDFVDPLTTTLYLMMSTPLQFVLCESGILPFKTNLLSVFPYNLLQKEHLKNLETIILEVPVEHHRETMETSGQYTLSIPLNKPNCHTFVNQKKVLENFVIVIFKNNKVYEDLNVCKTLCNIVLQRLMSKIQFSSDLIEYIVSLINSHGNSLLVSEEIGA